MDDIGHKHFSALRAAQEQCRSVQAQAHAMMEEANRVLEDTLHKLGDKFTADMVKRHELVSKAIAGGLSEEGSGSEVALGFELDTSELEALIKSMPTTTQVN